MRIDILTLFPNMFEGPFTESIIKRAQAGGMVEIHTHDIREYSTDKHGRVDDYQFGGGAGIHLAGSGDRHGAISQRAGLIQAKNVYPSEHLDAIKLLNKYPFPGKGHDADGKGKGC